MSEYDSLKKQIIWLAVLGICFLLVLVVFGYFIWNSYNSENTVSYTHLDVYKRQSCHHSGLLKKVTILRLSSSSTITTNLVVS